MLFFLLLLFSAPVFSPVFAEETIQLPTIVKEDLAGDLLLEDGVIPVKKGAVVPNSSSGTIQNSFENQVPLTTTNYGNAGGVGQILGLGSSTQDVDVQALGVSLNPPEGGGYDLAGFPQFLFSGFQFQAGPSVNAFNPSASAGTLSLTPWSSKVLHESGTALGAHEFYSTLGLNQLAAHFRKEETVAIVAGYSNINVVGPSAGLSAQWSREKYRGVVHFLGSDMTTQVPGPTTSRTPNATQRTSRAIPVLQNDFQVWNDSLFKTTLFYDWGFVDYEEPDSAYSYKTYSKQWGLETAFLTGAWKFGVSARQVSYNGSSFVAPLQSIGNLQASREIEFGSILLEPRVQGVWVTGLGFLPQGSLGIKKSWDGGRESLYSRWSYSQRVPTLIDRYGVFSTFVGNPDLKTETDWTGILGGEITEKTYEAGLQLYGQYRQAVRVPSGMTVTNMQDAYVAAIMPFGKVALSNFIDIYDTMTFSESYIQGAGSRFPYTPFYKNILGWSFHTSGKRTLDWSTSFRVASDAIDRNWSGAISTLPGYGVVDSAVRWNFWSSMNLAFRMENIFDKTIEYVKGYPTGRAFSVMLSGDFL